MAVPRAFLAFPAAAARAVSASASTSIVNGAKTAALKSSSSASAFASSSSVRAQQQQRALFSHSARRLADANSTVAQALPARRPVGAFRGGILGFLLGSTLSAYAVYYYILEEYRVSNELLTEDIYALQAAVHRIHSYVGTLEEKVATLEKRK